MDNGIVPLLYTLVGVGVVHGLVASLLVIVRRGAFPLLGREVSYIVGLAAACVIQGSYQLVRSALNIRCVYSLVFNVVIGLVALNLALVRLWRLWYLHFSTGGALGLARWRSKWRRRGDRARSRSISMAVRHKFSRVRSGSLSYGHSSRALPHRDRDRECRPRSRSVPSSPHAYASAFAFAGGAPGGGGAPSRSTSRRNSSAFTHRKEQADHDSLVAILDRGISSMNVLQHLHDHSDSASSMATAKSSRGAGGATGPASAPGSPMAKASGAAKAKGGGVKKAARRKTGGGGGRMRSNSLPAGAAAVAAAGGGATSGGGHASRGSRAYAASMTGDHQSNYASGRRMSRSRIVKKRRYMRNMRSLVAAVAVGTFVEVALVVAAFVLVGDPLNDLTASGCPGLVISEGVLNGLALATMVVLAYFGFAVRNKSDGYFLKNEMQFLAAWGVLFAIVLGMTQYMSTLPADSPMGRFVASFPMLPLLTFVGMQGFVAIMLDYPLWKSARFDFTMVPTAGKALSASASELPLLDILTDDKYLDDRRDFEKHLAHEFAVENMMFFQEAKAFQKACQSGELSSKEVAARAMSIYRDFIRTDAPFEVNLNFNVKHAVEQLLAAHIKSFAMPEHYVGGKRISRAAGGGNGGLDALNQHTSTSASLSMIPLPGNSGFLSETDRSCMYIDVDAAPLEREAEASVASSSMTSLATGYRSLSPERKEILRSSSPSRARTPRSMSLSPSTPSIPFRSLPATPLAHNRTTVAPHTSLTPVHRSHTAYCSENARTPSPRLNPPRRPPGSPPSQRRFSAAASPPSPVPPPRHPSSSGPPSPPPPHARGLQPASNSPVSPSKPPARTQNLKRASSSNALLSGAGGGFSSISRNSVPSTSASTGGGGRSRRHERLQTIISIQQPDELARDELRVVGVLPPDLFENARQAVYNIMAADTFARWKTVRYTTASVSRSRSRSKVSTFSRISKSARSTLSKRGSKSRSLRDVSAGNLMSRFNRSSIHIQMSGPLTGGNLAQGNIVPQRNNQAAAAPHAASNSRKKPPRSRFSSLSHSARPNHRDRELSISSMISRMKDPAASPAAESEIVPINTSGGVGVGSSRRRHKTVERAHTSGDTIGRSGRELHRERHRELSRVRSLSRRGTTRGRERDRERELSRREKEVSRLIDADPELSRSMAAPSIIMAV